MKIYGRYIEYLKVSGNRLLITEIRPIPLLLNAEGTVSEKTDKWMQLQHWQDLQLLLNSVVEEFEGRQVASLISDNSLNIDVHYKTSHHVRIAYRWREYDECQCFFLNATENDSSDSDSTDERLYNRLSERRPLTSLQPCGVVLSVAVSPTTPGNESASESFTGRVSKYFSCTASDGFHDVRMNMQNTDKAVIQSKKPPDGEFHSTEQSSANISTILNNTLSKLREVRAAKKRPRVSSRSRFSPSPKASKLSKYTALDALSEFPLEDGICNSIADPLPDFGYQSLRSSCLSNSLPRADDSSQLHDWTLPCIDGSDSNKSSDCNKGDTLIDAQCSNYVQNKPENYLESDVFHSSESHSLSKLDNDHIREASLNVTVTGYKDELRSPSSPSNYNPLISKFDYTPFSESDYSSDEENNHLTVLSMTPTFVGSARPALQDSPDMFANNHTAATSDSKRSRYDSDKQIVLSNPSSMKVLTSRAAANFAFSDNAHVLNNGTNIESFSTVRKFNLNYRIKRDCADNCKFDTTEQSQLMNNFSAQQINSGRQNVATIDKKNADLQHTPLEVEKLNSENYDIADCFKLRTRLENSVETSLHKAVIMNSVYGSKKAKLKQVEHSKPEPKILPLTSITLKENTLQSTKNAKTKKITKDSKHVSLEKFLIGKKRSRTDLTISSKSSFDCGNYVDNTDGEKFSSRSQTEVLFDGLSADRIKYCKSGNDRKNEAPYYNQKRRKFRSKSSSSSNFSKAFRQTENVGKLSQKKLTVIGEAEIAVKKLKSTVAVNALNGPICGQISSDEELPDIHAGTLSASLLCNDDIKPRPVRQLKRKPVRFVSPEPEEDLTLSKARSMQTFLLENRQRVPPSSIQDKSCNEYVSSQKREKSIYLEAATQISNEDKNVTVRKSMINRSKTSFKSRINSLNSGDTNNASVPSKSESCVTFEACGESVHGELSQLPDITTSFNFCHHNDQIENTNNSSQKLKIETVLKGNEAESIKLTKSGKTATSEVAGDAQLKQNDSELFNYSIDSWGNSVSPRSPRGELHSTIFLEDSMQQSDNDEDHEKGLPADRLLRIPTRIAAPVPEHLEQNRVRDIVALLRRTYTKHKLEAWLPDHVPWLRSVLQGCTHNHWHETYLRGVGAMNELDIYCYYGVLNKVQIMTISKYLEENMADELKESLHHDPRPLHEYIWRVQVPLVATLMCTEVTGLSWEHATDVLVNARRAGPFD